MSTQAEPRIVLVGHCGPDSWMLKGVASRAVPAAAVVFASSQADAEREADTADLLLVNRLLDGSFLSESGVELIAGLAGRGSRRAALMLVSNFDDAQQAAVRAGAVSGFGKSSAGQAQTALKILAAVESAASSPRGRMPH